MSGTTPTHNSTWRANGLSGLKKIELRPALNKRSQWMLLLKFLNISIGIGKFDSGIGKDMKNITAP